MSKEQHEKEVMAKFRAWTYSLTPKQYKKWWQDNWPDMSEKALKERSLPTTEEHREGWRMWLTNGRTNEAIHRKSDNIMGVVPTGTLTVGEKKGGKRRKSKKRKSKKRKSKKRKSKNRRKKGTRKSRRR